MATFIQEDDFRFSEQLNTFAEKLPNYATTLGLTAAEVAGSVADAAYFAHIIGIITPIRTYSKAITNYKDLARHGNGSEVMGALPTPPTLGTAPTLVDANIEKRFSDLAARIKKSPNYTKTIGEDLGIEKAQTSFNPQDGQPTFYIELEAGHPVLVWKKGKYQGVEIWKDSGSGWAKLDKDNNPNYTDESPLPAAGASAVWNYKMIYLYKDATVGRWSNEVSVTVNGAV